VARNILIGLGGATHFFKDGIYTVTAVLDYEYKIESVSKEAQFNVSGNNIEMIPSAKAGN